MVKLQIEHEGLAFLLRLLPREMCNIHERLDKAIAADDGNYERRLTARENACKRLLAACQNAWDNERRKAVK